MERNNLIINADDFGHSEARTVGICESFKKRYISRTSIMLNMPDVENAIRIAEREGFYDRIGLHLNLTEGIPMTDTFLQCDRFLENGQFSKKKIFQCVRSGSLSRDEKDIIRLELSAQIKKYLELGFPLRNIDSHHHIHNELQILNIVLPLISDFKTMRIARNLFARNGLGFIKKFYKSYLNNKIGNKRNTEYFGSYTDYKMYYKGSGSCEVMVHPEMKEEEIYDRISNDKYVLMSEYTYEK